MSGRNAIFAASRQVAELIEEPEFISDDEGQRWEAEALLGPWLERYPILVKFLPVCPGIAFPYHAGDLVEVVQAQADALVVGVYDAGAIDHEGHTVLGPRHDTNKDLRLGPVEGGEWEPVALYSRMARELRLLRYLLQQLASAVPGGAAALEAAEASALANPDIGINTVTGGDPASRVKGRKAG